MKKTILLLAALILLSFITNAQDKANTSATGKATTPATGKAFDENSRILNIGFGLGRNYYRVAKNNGYYQTFFPAINISYEQPYKKRLGPGFLGVGGYLAFKTTTYGYDDVYWNNSQKYYYKHTYNNIFTAARAAYHWDGLNFEKGEIYGGVLLGLRIQTYKYKTDDPYYDDDHKVESGMKIFPEGALFVGARWMFAKRVGLYAELGTSISWITGGLSFKL